ncbi:MAG: PilZ domain-containing protein [Thermodesulfobacteriota bacterium]
MSERRRIGRRYLIAEVKVNPLDGREPMGAEAVDINRGGMGVYLLNEVREGEKVLVEVIFATEDDTRVTEEINGIIRWVHPVGGNYAAGIKFDEAVTKKYYPALSACLGRGKTE